jgi:hypothetical protein
MHQQNAPAAKVLEGHSPSCKVGESEAGEIALKWQPPRLSILTMPFQPNSRCLPILLELVQTEQYSTLLLHYLVKAYPEAQQN